MLQTDYYYVMNRICSWHGSSYTGPYVDKCHNCYQEVKYHELSVSVRQLVWTDGLTHDDNNDASGVTKMKQKLRTSGSTFPHIIIDAVIFPRVG